MSYPFEIRTIPYSLLRMQPHLDATSMYLHYHGIFNYDKRRLNHILSRNKQLQNMSLEELYFDPLPLTDQRTQTLVRNFSASVYHHELFFMNFTSAANAKPPVGPLGKAINNTYGSFEKFREIFTAAALSALLPGWIFLCTGRQGDIHIEVIDGNRIPNVEFVTPIAVMDVFEHAFYLQFTTHFEQYVTAWLDTQNYNQIERLFVAAQKTPQK